MKRITEKWRKTFFWIIDTLKGGQIRSHYRDIKIILEKFGTPESDERRKVHLNNLLEHAVNTTEFYKQYREYESLKDFPIINKSIIREHFNTIQSKKFRNKKVHKMATSGSSGTPFTTLQNTNKKLRNTADTIYFKQKAGFEIGYRMYYIRKWFKMHRKNMLTTKMRNIVMVNVTEFTDDYLAKLITRLRSDTSTKVILSYSSALRDICKYLDRVDAKPIDANISCIIAMAEGLSSYTREALKKHFNAPVLMRYSNMENGILSLQLTDSDTHLQINWASYFIELLHPDKDVPVEDGELGRVVVTDLFNYCMPFIRYDTGDMARMEPNSIFNPAPAFFEIHGRKMDMIYDTQGNVQSTFIIFHLEEYSEIKQFQFIQEGQKQYRLKLNLDGGFHHEDKIIKLFKSYLGDDAEIRITYESEIAQLSSGKRRLIINEYVPEDIDMVTLST